MTPLARIDAEIAAARAAILAGEEPLEGLLQWYADWCAEREAIKHGGVILFNPRSQLC